jgi:hypothetical protein
VAAFRSDRFKRFRATVLAQVARAVREGRFVDEGKGEEEGGGGEGRGLKLSSSSSSSGGKDSSGGDTPKSSRTAAQAAYVAITTTTTIGRATGSATNGNGGAKSNPAPVSDDFLQNLLKVLHKVMANHAETSFSMLKLSPSQLLTEKVYDE